MTTPDEVARRIVDKSPFNTTIGGHPYATDNELLILARAVVERGLRTAGTVEQCERCGFVIVDGMIADESRNAKCEDDRCPLRTAQQDDGGKG